MRVQSAWLVWVGVTGALVACAGAVEPRPETTSTQSPSAEEPHAQVGSPSSATAEPTPEVPVVDEPTPRLSGEPTPTFYTSVSFALRSLPHRAPYDVDGRLVSGRVELLMQRVRDAAGEPAPRLVVFAGASVFRAEFFGREPEALSQCQRVVDAVATPETDPASRSPRAELDGVRATPCAAIDADAP